MRTKRERTYECVTCKFRCFRVSRLPLIPQGCHCGGDLAVLRMWEASQVIYPGTAGITRRLP